MDQIDTAKIMTYIDESIRNERMVVWRYIYDHSKEYDHLMRMLTNATNQLPSDFDIISYADPEDLAHYVEPYLFVLGFFEAVHPSENTAAHISQQFEIIKNDTYKELFFDYQKQLNEARKQAKSIEVDIEKSILYYQRLALIGFKWNMLFGYYYGISFNKNYLQNEHQKYTRAFKKTVNQYWDGDFYELCGTVY